MTTNKSDTKTHLVFWWIIPCKAISGVFRELSMKPQYRVSVICAGDLSTARKQLGWTWPDFGEAEVCILPQKNWKSKVDEILGTSKNALHIYNGVQAYDQILYSLRKAVSLRIQTAVMTESQNNAYTGIGWIAKEIYGKLVLPFRTSQLARQCLFVLCLSGSSEKASRSLRRLGWREDQIFPFGYFSEEMPKINESLKTNRDNIITQILCTGLLTRNKGHSVLMHALSILKKSGLKFQCCITGYGPEKERLLQLSKSLELDDGTVVFKGVIPTEELNQMMLTGDIFVAPGIREPWGIRINEAIQAGLALVVSDGIGACEIVEASGSGAVFSSGDANELANALSTMLSQPNYLDKCKKYSRDYRHRIAPRVAADYFNAIIKHVLERNRERPTPHWL